MFCDVYFWQRSRSWRAPSLYAPTVLVLETSAAIFGARGRRDLPLVTSATPSPRPFMAQSPTHLAVYFLQRPLNLGLVQQSTLPFLNSTCVFYTVGYTVIKTVLYPLVSPWARHLSLKSTVTKKGFVLDPTIT